MESATSRLTATRSTGICPSAFGSTSATGIHPSVETSIFFLDSVTRSSIDIYPCLIHPCTVSVKLRF